MSRLNIIKKIKKDCKRKLVKGIKSEKSDNMVVNIRKTSQKNKNKSLLSKEKKYYRMRKNALL